MGSVSILLHRPKFIENIGMIARIGACYGVQSIWYSGERINFDVPRLPRELRMREYANSRPKPVANYRRALAMKGLVPVAVEVIDDAETLPDFKHPDKAMYVFGPEDGSLPQDILRLCHRFVRVPTQHCLSLPVAVATVLYDRSSRQAGQ